MIRPADQHRPGSYAAEVTDLGQLIPMPADPDAVMEVYRQDPACVRIRVVDSAFEGTSLSERHKSVWPFLDGLPDDDIDSMSLLLLLTPEEAKDSFAKFNFEHPTR